MKRNKIDLQKVRRIVSKLLQGLSHKQIAFEEDLHIHEASQSCKRVTVIKKKYLSVTKVLRLNNKGLLLMDERQLALPLKRKPDLRVEPRVRQSLPRQSRARRRPRSLV